MVFKHLRTYTCYCPIIYWLWCHCQSQGLQMTDQIPVWYLTFIMMKSSVFKVTIVECTLLMRIWSVTMWLALPTDSYIKSKAKCKSMRIQDQHSSTTIQDKHTVAKCWSRINTTKGRSRIYSTKWRWGSTQLNENPGSTQLNKNPGSTQPNDDPE